MATLLPPAHPDVRVWLVDLDTDDTAASLALLSPDETARAGRFAFDHHRRRFVAGRAGLRRILADELNLRPAALSFTYNASGKPELHPTAHSPRSLRFNVSHSDRYALVATTTAGAVGVDIEKTRPIADVLRLARTAFSSSELEALTAKFLRQSRCFPIATQGTPSMTVVPGALAPSPARRSITVPGPAAAARRRRRRAGGR